jgi:hypothetical protein
MRRSTLALALLVLAVAPLAVEAALGFASSPDLVRYGTIDFPGSGMVRLPQDRVAVSFQISESVSGSNEFAKPETDVTLTPADGGGEPIEGRFGGKFLGIIGVTAREETTSDHTRAQIGSIEVPRAGEYRVEATERRPVFGTDQKLAFGEHRPLFEPLPFWAVVLWLLGGLLLAVVVGRPRGGYLRWLWRRLNT